MALELNQAKSRSVPEKNLPALHILLIVIRKKCKSLAYKTTAQLPAVTTVKALRG